MLVFADVFVRCRKRFHFYFCILQAKNARFEYSIIGDLGDYFKIDPNIGRIELNKKMDFETKHQFTFVVSYL